MEPCVFCKIVDGTFHCMKVYEDEDTLALMDIAGDVDGHILVIPKVHCKNILDCNEKLFGHVMSTVKLVSNHLVDHCGYDGVDIMNANDESAGQSMMHLHIHIIPRKANDGLGTVGEWPTFIGAKRKIEEVFEEVRMQ